MSEQTSSSFWVDRVADELIKSHPKGEIIVSSGHSPSGNYHIGTLREILTASAITYAISQRGRRAKHIDFVDDFDVLRKVPANVDEQTKRYIGRPLYLVPDPYGCHDNYSAHFIADLHEATDALGVQMETVYAHDAYPAGKFTEAIEQSLTRLNDVKRIISEVSRRQLPDDWVPVQLLSDDNNLREWQFVDWSPKDQEIIYKDKDGQTGKLSYASGRVKLDWRLDWPARWAIWRVQAEPFGRDHATKGGSYDTGRELVKEIFDGRAPYPVPYDFVNRAGETKKMSKSSGDVITANGALEIMPAEILRYFILRSVPSRMLSFDTGMGVYNLIEEYGRVEQAVLSGAGHEFAEAYAIAKAQVEEQTISSVPFGHLVSVFQAARGDQGETLGILARTGYEAAVQKEWAVIARELNFVASWIEKYAPEELKFTVQDKLPEVELSADQKGFLDELADKIEPHDDLDGQGMHDLIYGVLQSQDLKPGMAFQAIYRVILGKDSGPKAGWFLATLDHDWLVNRLKRLG